MIGRRLVVVLVAAGLTAVACQPFGPSSGCTAQIDWVDFVQIGSTQYVAGMGSPETADPSQLGAVIAHVRFKVSGNVCDPNYRVKDGDAAFLDPGTPVYELAGHPAGEAVAASHDGRLLVYRAYPMPRGS